MDYLERNEIIISTPDRPAKGKRVLNAAQVSSPKKARLGNSSTKFLRKAAESVGVQMSNVCGMMVIWNKHVTAILSFGCVPIFSIHWCGDLFGTKVVPGFCWMFLFLHSNSKFFYQERLLWHGTSWECVPNIVCLRPICDLLHSLKRTSGKCWFSHNIHGTYVHLP